MHATSTFSSETFTSITMALVNSEWGYTDFESIACENSRTCRHTCCVWIIRGRSGFVRYYCATCFVNGRYA